MGYLIKCIVLACCRMCVPILSLRHEILKRSLPFFLRLFYPTFYLADLFWCCCIPNSIYADGNVIKKHYAIVNFLLWKFELSVGRKDVITEIYDLQERRGKG